MWKMNTNLRGSSEGAVESSAVSDLTSFAPLSSHDFVRLLKTHKQGSPFMLDATAGKCCDECRHQEGRHYCLLHGVTVKNMDALRCRDFGYCADK
jgi:hypothetical protein